ncbi:hypothetical protein Syun_014141 [Stephania yunnanensis]|uniref:Uncharacterized protein n=1 Tax=Stephania yunnanensis TaxID=152371 RepID=A0AAP0JIR6_9MAGN
MGFHASSSSSTPLLPLRRFAEITVIKPTSRPPSSISSSSSSSSDSSSSSSHRDRRLRRFAERTGTKPESSSPIRRFADSSSSSDSSSPIRYLSAEEYIATAATPHRRGVRRSDSTKRFEKRMRMFERRRKRYPVLCRRSADLNEEFVSFNSPSAGFDFMAGKRIEQKLLDYNQEAERFGGYSYEELSEVSPDHRFLAYTMYNKDNDSFRLSIRT